MRIHVRGQQIGERHDIVIEKQHDVAAGLDQALIHCAGIDGSGSRSHRMLPLALHTVKHGIDLPGMFACLVEHQNLGGTRLKSQQGGDGIDQDLLATIRRYRNR